MSSHTVGTRENQITIAIPIGQIETDEIGQRISIWKTRPARITKNKSK